ncbi:trigger factor [Halopseudomonas aestusnigri]|jgi:trigger factor|uniref:trigger factor n=2 Tax=Pseudomonadales TaxID=72274 RepID=UPI000C97B2E1|nr:trigger factor [Halopseudomonas aestusnigri]MAK73296.1 trigger factor [Pseudomonadales bacterium]MEE2799824.1 trigger factor [Pseudomonadota bacterium]HCP04206.1 trigger factor [Pseudomonas sp.]MAP77125.1 trigger factor [Pseudomonadales bacterium]MCK5532838.1 trigger factor [Halopseudomonas aestusnigri]|tara:strand:- start:11426 stop:12772 length:1347 start_codon:yes stop_codon:yes gene_type:complete
MQVSVETTSGLERRMTVGIPADRIENEVNKRLQQTAKRARVDGFRPGKVPMSVIRKRFGASAHQEVIGEVIQSSFYEAIMQEKLNPAGAPSVEPKSMEAGKDFEYVATFEVYPEVTLAGFEAISVERPESEVTEADVDTMLETLRKQNTRFEAVERAAENGDQVTIDFVGKIDGEAFQGGTANGTNLVLGSGRMIPGFEEGLVGAKAGDSLTLKVTFPEDYQNLDLAGKAAEFETTVQAVAAPALPELNDEFFAQFGVNEGGLEGFRAEVRKNMERELRQAIKTKVKGQVMDGLLKTNTVEVPKALISNEIDRLREQAVQQFGGANIQASQLPAELFEEQAKRRVSLGLIVAEVVKQNDIKPDNDRVRAMVEELASAYQEPEQVVNWYYQNEQQLGEIQSVVLEEQVVDTVLQKAQVTDKKVAYEEAVKPAQPAQVEAGEAEEAKADE